MTVTLKKESIHQKPFLVRYFRTLQASAVIWTTASEDEVRKELLNTIEFENSLPPVIQDGCVTSAVDSIAIPICQTSIRPVADDEAIKDNSNNMPYTPTMAAVREVLDDLFNLIQQKNAAYGDAALNPLRVFSKGLSVEDMLRVRMDDKLSRMSRGAKAGEDPEWDLFGYLVLLFANRKRQAQIGKEEAEA